MTSVLLVEWLPRGGIAQVTEAWRRIGVAAGLDVITVGRAGSELAPEIAVQRRLPGKLGAVEAHLRLTTEVCRAIGDRKPDVVYVQNYWVPAIEQAVLRVAKRHGARTVLAIHNASPHSRMSGTSAGLRRLVLGADEVVTHSEFVAGEVQRTYSRRPKVVEHPLPTGLLGAATKSIAGLGPTEGILRAVSFGVLRRSYKGADVLGRIAGELPEPWELVTAGVGSPTAHSGRHRSIDRFLLPGELTWLVGSGRTCLLPYRRASQSGAVVLAQALGAPPIVTAVGGIAEQVTDGVDGVLLQPGASCEQWLQVLRKVANETEWWTAVCRQALERSAERARRSASGWLGAIGSEHQSVPSSREVREPPRQIGEPRYGG